MNAPPETRRERPVGNPALSPKAIDLDADNSNYAPELPAGQAPSPSRGDIDQLVSAAVQAAYSPRWLTHPGNETEFIASLVMLLGGAITLEFDAADRLVNVRGIRLRGAA